MSVLAVDASNYTAPMTPELLAGWKAEGVGLVIVQAVNPPAGYPPGVTRQQIQACLDAGFVVDAYVWLWFDADISDIIQKLALLSGLNVRRLWLDVEDTAASKYSDSDCQAKVSAALVECDTISPIEHPTGIYTGRWFWADPRYMANTPAFSDRSLWDSDYDGVVDAGNFHPYGGWTQRAIKQYAGTQLAGTDLNVLSDEEAAELAEGADVTDQERADMQSRIDGLVNSLGYIAGDVLKPLTRASAAAYVKTAVTQIRAQADQQGISHA